MQFDKSTYGHASVCFSKFEKGMVNEYNLTITANNTHDFATQISAIENAAKQWFSQHQISNQNIVFQRIFVSDIANQMPALTPLMLVPNCSVVQQAPIDGSKLVVCLVVWQAQNIGIKTINKANLFEHNGYLHHFTTGLCMPQHLNAFNQTNELFQSYGQMLAQHGMGVETNCHRTWLFVRDIDNNYKDMVEARNAFFETEGLTAETHYISSTGIEGQTTTPATLVSMDAYAVKGLEPGQVKYLKASENLSPTNLYGVAFERGTAITYADRSHIFISGTASIDKHGHIMHENNVIKQTERVFDNIAALLNEAGACMNDVNMMIVYLRDFADRHSIMQYMQTHYKQIPTVLVMAPVCRPGWLIEVECTASISANNSQFAAL